MYPTFHKTMDGTTHPGYDAYGGDMCPSTRPLAIKTNQRPHPYYNFMRQRVPTTASAIMDDKLGVTYDDDGNCKEETCEETAENGVTYHSDNDSGTLFFYKN